MAKKTSGKKKSGKGGGKCIEVPRATFNQLQKHIGAMNAAFAKIVPAKT